MGAASIIFYLGVEKDRLQLLNRNKKLPISPAALISGSLNKAFPSHAEPGSVQKIRKTALPVSRAVFLI
jgi:hypothetical protein